MESVLTSQPHITLSAPQRQQPTRDADTPVQREAVAFAKTLEKEMDLDAYALRGRELSNSRREKDSFNRTVLGAMSAMTVAAFAYTVRRHVRGQLPAVENHAGGALKNPRLVAYTYAGGAFGAATVITGLGAFALFTGVWSYLGVNTWQEFNYAVRQRFQESFPSLVINREPEPKLSQDPTWRELVREVRKELAEDERKAGVPQTNEEQKHWSSVLKRAGEGAMAGAIFR